MRPIRMYYNEEKEQHSKDFEETSKNFLKFLNLKKKKDKTSEHSALLSRIQEDMVTMEYNSNVVKSK